MPPEYAAAYGALGHWCRGSTTISRLRRWERLPSQLQAGAGSLGFERIDPAENAGLAAVAGDFQIVVGLNAHPQSRRDVEQASQFEGHFGAHRALVPDDWKGARNSEFRAGRSAESDESGQALPWW